MILWTIKQLLSLRKAVTGRAHPSELAWGLAIGLAIGLVPKGNLVSVMLIAMAVSFRINHGMAALSAVIFSFLAVQIDPLTHELGAGILGNQRIREVLDRWWDTPLVPWTDLNNTVVMGSTAIALISLVPTAVVSLPVFRWLAPRKQEDAQSNDPPPQEFEAESVAAVKQGVPRLKVAAPDGEEQRVVVAPATVETVQGETASVATIITVPTEEAVAKLNLAAAQKPQHEPVMETHIDIIRLSHPIEDGDGELASDSGSMNEALGYLLRRLRDSRQGKAA